MATSKPVRKRLITPKFRVSFPDVFVKKAFQGQPEENARFACAALFPGWPVNEKGSTAMSANAPESWTPKDRELWKAIVGECNAVALETFKKPMKDLDRGVYKLPFHRGEEKTYQGYGLGVVYFTMSAKNQKPSVTDWNGNALTADTFYPGCWARASVTPFAFDNIGKGIALGLNHIRKVAEGERLDSFTTADQDFGNDPNDFGDEAAGSDAEFGGEETGASQSEDEFA